MNSEKISSSDEEYPIENDEEFKEETVLTFAFEMFHYLLVRRLCTFCCGKIVPSGLTVFTEQIGQAVLLKWHKQHESFKEILRDDFPKYVNTSEFFRRYATDRCVKMFDDVQQCAVDRILTITAFILEMACFCFEMGHLDFVDNIHKDWTVIFMGMCSRTLKGVGGWLTLVKTCTEISTLYESEIEKRIGDGCNKFNLKFFIPHDMKEVEEENTTASCYKAVTYFQTYDLETETFIPPPQFPINLDKFSLEFNCVPLKKNRKTVKK